MEKKLNDDTEINVGMIDKKLTDEEIVKALECCSSGQTGEVCKKCPLRVECVCNSNKIEEYALDLIQRLQNEKSQWKSKAEHIEQVYDADREHFIKTTAEQKAEIERLTEWKDKLQDTKDELEQQLIDTGFKEYCEENKRLTDENAELQKQVDELTAKYRNLENNYEYTHELYRQYEKQVDELKTKCQKAYTEGYEQGKFDSAQEKQQAVKDTAKEILSEFYLWIGQDFDDIPTGGFIHIMKEDFKRRMNEFYKRYGVEVE